MRISLGQFDIEIRIQERQTETAATRAFAIPETLEQILLLLPIQNIFVTTMVSRAFRNTIKGSSKLQKAMFTTYDTEVTQSQSGLPAQNPILEVMLQVLGFNLIRQDYKKTASKVVELDFERSSRLVVEGMDDLASYARDEGGWRDLKLTNLSSAAKICIINGAEEPVKHYHDVKAEEATIGTVWDLALLARERSLKKMNGTMRNNLRIPDEFKESIMSVTLSLSTPGQKLRVWRLDRERSQDDDDWILDSKQGNETPVLKRYALNREKLTRGMRPLGNLFSK